MRNGHLSRSLKSRVFTIYGLRNRSRHGLLAISHRPWVPSPSEPLHLRWLITRATVQVDSLPSGTFEQRGALADVKDEPIYPTMLRQVRDNMRKYKDCVLLTRVGSFYELYFEQAEKYGPLLNLTRARKRVGKGTVPMVRAVILLSFHTQR